MLTRIPTEHDHVPSLPQRRAGRGTGRAQRGAAEPRGGRKGAGERSMAERRERGGRAAHTLSIADGTALHRGRVGSRHFQKPLGFVLGASLFVGVIIPFPAAVGISFRAMPCIKCPSKRKLSGANKQAVNDSEHLIQGEKKS